MRSIMTRMAAGVAGRGEAAEVQHLAAAPGAVDRQEVARQEARPYLQGSVVGKQSKKTLFDIFGHYIEGYMTLFDTIWSVK